MMKKVLMAAALVVATAARAFGITYQTPLQYADVPAHATLTFAGTYNTGDAISESVTGAAEGATLADASLATAGWTITATADEGYATPAFKTCAYGAGNYYTEASTTTVGGPMTVAYRTVAEGASLYGVYVYDIVCTARVYTVSFNANGGSVGTESKTVSYDSTYGALPVPTRADYSFNGWYTDAEGGAQVTADTKVSILAGQTLYAHWTADDVYTVAFHRNYGADAVSYGTMKADGAVVTPDVLNRLGYDNLGWAKRADAAAPNFAALQEVTVSELTFVNFTSHLYRVWSPHHYTISYDGNAAAATGAMANQAMTYGEEAALTANAFARTGYTFAGWAERARAATADFADGETVGDLTSTDGATVTLYAVWQANAYAIAFDKDDANAAGTMAPVAATYDVKVTLPACAFTKDGYDFTGWAAAADGAAEYADGAAVSNLTATADATATLYATWHAQTYAVAFDANGGAFADDGAVSRTRSFTVDQTYGALPTVTNANAKMAFDGWRDADGRTVTAADVVPPPSAGVTALTAAWVKDDPLARAVDVEELDFTTESTAAGVAWTLQTEVTADGVDAAMSGEIPADATENKTVTLSTTVVGPGTLSFKWKISSVSLMEAEDDPEGWWDRTPEFLVFKRKAQNDAEPSILFKVMSSPTKWLCVTNEEAATLTVSSGAMPWTEQTVVIEAEADETNTVSWVFQYTYDDYSSTWTSGHGYVDQVVWTPAGGAEVTPTHRVPYAWLKETFSEAASATAAELETLAESASPNGKAWPDGTAVKVWEDYVAGTNPHDATDLFRALISMTNDVPYIGWEPDLSKTGTPVRVYRVQALESLDGVDAADPDAWADVTDLDAPARAAYHFFRVLIDW